MARTGTGLVVALVLTVLSIATCNRLRQDTSTGTAENTRFSAGNSTPAVEEGLQGVSDPTTRETVRRGNVLVARIRTFRESRGRYPSSLDELGDLSALQPTMFAPNWEYHVIEDGKQFTLAVGIRSQPEFNLYPVLFYDYRSRSWRLDQ